jgi:primosomal protein N' (replication factor Y)
MTDPMHSDGAEARPLVARIAVPAPLHTLFDYRIPAGIPVARGVRVLVPFGRSRRVGVVLEVAPPGDCPEEKLRAIELVLDAAPALPEETLDLLEWVAAYYHHPIGEVVQAALPPRMRRAVPLPPLQTELLALTDAGRAQCRNPPPRAPRQAAVLAWLGALAQGQAEVDAVRAAFPGSAPVVRALLARGWIERRQAAVSRDAAQVQPAPYPLTPEQDAAVAALEAASGSFSVTLLDGVTGSGKTEVYLQLAARTLARGLGVLVLVPEIALTPQLYERFRARLGSTVRVLHSGLAETAREDAWLRLRHGLSQVLLGTRSSVLAPVERLGLVVVDEEHDPSYKQVEGLRYSARDLAVMRGRLAGCPVLLGSATPSLESLRNAQAGRYRHLHLESRAAAAAMPRMDLVDIRGQPLQAGLGEPLLRAVEDTLERGEQAILFLNRRGFAPVLSCFSCGWVSDCPRCDARQTLHRASGILWCHHCGSQRPAPAACPECGADDLHPLGQGTEQLEQFLSERFAGYPLVRLDRDATARRGSLEQQLRRLHDADAALLVGTQMLAKGHHFPRVTLVGVVDADAGLFSADFRSTERMAQLLVQVAGRAGRAERPGRVLIQTRYPDHPLLRTLVREGYPAFAAYTLDERRAAELPPFCHQALLRAESADVGRVNQFLGGLADWAAREAGAAVQLWGPVPAPMARRAGRHRAHLLLQSTGRAALHRLLAALVSRVATMRGARQVRWSLDVDPGDLY